MKRILLEFDTFSLVVECNHNYVLFLQHLTGITERVTIKEFCDIIDRVVEQKRKERNVPPTR